MTAAALPADQLDALANALEKHALYTPRQNPALNLEGNPPSIKQELERKTLDELQRLILALEHGKVSPSQFNAAVRSLWQATAGLVSKDIMNLIEQTKAQLLTDDDAISRSYVSRDRATVISVDWLPGRESVKVTRIADGKRTNSVAAADPASMIPSKDARDQFARICKRLEEAGMEKL
jgi:hypothetical protein